ncbi:major facilitator superfamily domain-containing protein [Dichomitus squalens]|uniref:Major facilitator superfamily domain-containing protein n=1 Tax=Dichomitus squalens TaxID=114155 RepID=A0A4Q9M5W4_9APHY|nr:major facilitator superfamily domain-containing protein [Dichomitus squalens]
MSETSTRKHGQDTRAKRSMSLDVILMGTVTLAMILNNMTAVSISLPTIGKDLNIVESKLQWIISAYALSLLSRALLRTTTLLRITFIIGCACMGVFGLGCGFAQDEITLDILRGLQGLGPAASVPAALGILAHTFPPSPIRSIAFATFAAGGSYRLSALCCLGGLMFIDADIPYAFPDKRIDWLWALLVASGLVFIIFILSDGPIAPDGWKTGYIITLLIVGVFLFVLFVVWEHYLERMHARGEETSQRWWTPPPLMPVSIWRRADGKLAAIFNTFIFWVQLYYQDYLNLNPILTMVRLLPMLATGIICNMIVALVVGRVPLVWLVVIGTLLTGASNLLFTVIVLSAPYWAFGFPAAIITVFCADFVFATGTLFVARVCLPHEQSIGGTLFQTPTQLGTSFGLVISTVVFNATLKSKAKSLGVALNAGGTNVPKPAQLTVYNHAMWSGFAFGMFGVLLAIPLLRGVGVVGHRKGDSDDESEKTALEPEDRDPEAVC